MELLSWMAPFFFIFTALGFSAWVGLSQRFARILTVLVFALMVIPGLNLPGAGLVFFTLIVYQVTCFDMEREAKEAGYDSPT